MNSITIGEDCLVGWDVTIMDNDGGHAVIDSTTKVKTNNSKPIVVGNHCWLSSKVTLLKGTTIPDDCAIGYNTSVIGKSFNTTNSIIAGNPPQVIKENIKWEH